MYNFYTNLISSLKKKKENAPSSDRSKHMQSFEEKDPIG